MEPEDDPEFIEMVEETILDLSSAELNFYEMVSKELGVDPAVVALKPFYRQYLAEEGSEQ